jgi:hypothetical protein
MRTSMARHIIMDSSGHSTIEFDKTNAADLAEAERRFRKLTAKGFLAAEQKGGGQHRISEGDRKFDPDAEETIFIPALKGG